ncbi:IGFBP domain-containing protein [Periophthalmus magnuspinnatus]|uniref:IGFBP domain-containing protein n=1 Tax=Periophthalmus magnuspinnatus TaxID=409849 RepID=UPI00145B0D8A|nr:IGFBP domain-containing protein [Periophthalmus magnuspinnatus]
MMAHKVYLWCVYKLHCYICTHSKTYKMWMCFLGTFVLGALGITGDSPPQDVRHQHLKALHCPPCERIHCSPRQAPRLRCKGGATTGVCGCCPVCARTEDETCGGAWDYLGKCDQGLVCVYGESGQDKTERTGICKAVIEPLDSDSCHPECTKEFCNENPTKICSARLVSLERRPCQGSCQHTSCSACVLLVPPYCPQTCPSSDASCLQHFGKCVHSHLLTSLNQPVCHHNIQSNSGGRLVCLVPDCPNASK